MNNELRKIIYVEDDEIVSEIVQMTLEDLGDFEVRCFSSGQQLVNNIPQINEQLLLIDMMMPEMDGIETVTRLQEVLKEDMLPFIFMTARAQNHEQQVYKEMGALGVIVKPFDPLQLSDQIRELWNSRHE